MLPAIGPMGKRHAICHHGAMPSSPTSDTGRLVLASGSAARAAVLDSLGIAFDPHPAAVDERAIRDRLHAAGVTAAPIALALAEAKAQAVRPLVGARWLLAADQIALVGTGPGRCILDKPGSMAAAVDQLTALAGTSHRLINGILLVAPDGREWRGVDRHRIVMTAFSRHQAAAYVRDFRPLECVGAYRIEDRAGLIERVEHLDGGGESGVMGLPATLFERLARRAGLWSLLS